MVVPRQQLINAESPDSIRRGDDYDVTQALRDQLQSEEDERAHECLAQLRIRLDQRQELLAIELDHFASLADAQTCNCAAAANHGAFAGELTGLEPDDESLGRTAGTNRFDFAGYHGKERKGPVSDLDEHLAA